MGLHFIDEEFEYFEESFVREVFDSDLLKLAYAYTTHTLVVALQGD